MFKDKKRLDIEDDSFQEDNIYNNFEKEEETNKEVEEPKV